MQKYLLDTNICIHFLRGKFGLISDFDLLIGCTAVEKKMVMVTENLKEFERISGIEIDNWVRR